VWHILHVTKRSATQIVCAYPNSTAAERFRAKDGRIVGGSGFHRRRLVPLTEEIRAEVESDRNRSRLRYAAWDKYPDSVIRAVVAALDTAMGLEATNGSGPPKPSPAPAAPAPSLPKNDR
jgi:hypothetical protein